MENVTSMVYIKNSIIIGDSGNYEDLIVSKNSILIKTSKLYHIAHYV